MKSFTLSDKRRLAQSVLVAIALHAVVFIVLSIVIAVNGVRTEEHVGMITLNLDTALPPGPSGPAAAFQPARADPPAPSAKPKSDEPKIAAPKSVELKTTVAEKTKPSTNTTAPEKSGTVREPGPAKPAAANREETSADAAAPPSQLDRGSLARLDAALEASAGSGSGTGAGTGGGGGGRRTSTSWEDNAARELVSQAAPVIPRWVSEQGLRLKVELAVELNADGLVFVRNVRISSGYPDVDAAVARAVSRWKYSRGAGTQTVRGAIMYFIELK